MGQTQIEKFREEERVRISFLKHRGDILTIIDDTGCDLKYVTRVISRIKKKQRGDVDRLVANDIAQIVLSGSEQRERCYLVYLNSLEGKETARVSLCHKVPVKEHHFDDDTYYVCLSCGETCGTKVVERIEIHKLVLEYNKQLREEAKFLVEFAEKMGYTNKVTVAGDRITQYNLVIPGEKANEQTLSELQNLTGPERQQIRRKLEQTIIDSEFEDSNENSKK